MKYLASKKLALVLIIALAVISAAGTIVPQAGGLQFNRVYASWWMKVVFGLFFVNLAACTYLQAKRQARVTRGIRPGYKYREISLPVMPQAETIMRHLAARRFKTVLEPERAGGVLIRGDKWLLAGWSAVVFHVGLLVVVTGILVSGLTRTDGIIPVMEGETVTEDSDSYVVLEKGILAGGYSYLPIRLDRVAMATDPGSKTIKSETTVFTFGGQNVRLDSRHPVTARGFTIYRDRTGYSLTVGRSGSKGVPGDITFPLLPDSTGQNTFSNQISLPGTSYSLHATLYPNAVKYNEPAGLYRTDGNVLLNPVVRIILRDPAGRTIRDLYLAEGGTFTVDGTGLAIRDIGRWSSLRLVRDPGVPVIYAGCTVSVLALLAMYFFIPQQLYVKIGINGAVEIGGWAGRYRSLFRDEMEKLLIFLTKGEAAHDSGPDHTVLDGCQLLCGRDGILRFKP